MLLIEKAIALFGRIPYALIALVARVAPAAVFWQSGQTKLEGWHVSDNAIYLFREEYRLPLVDPVIAAHLAAFAEHVRAEREKWGAISKAANIKIE